MAVADTNLEVLIDGRFYDVSKMKHPGGSVIKFYAGKGIDATQAFDNFHLRSKKAKKMLEHLPSRAADEKELEKNLLPGQASLLEDFNQLSRDCKSNFQHLEKGHFCMHARLTLSPDSHSDIHNVLHDHTSKSCISHELHSGVRRIFQAICQSHNASTH